MAGISKIAKARQQLLTRLPHAKTKIGFELALDDVRMLLDAANASRGMYKGSAKARKIIQATEECTWDMAQVMNEVLLQWDYAEPNIDLIVAMLIVGVKHVDGTPLGYGQEPSPESIHQVVAHAVDVIKSRLPTEQKLTAVGQELSKVISPSARLVDPSVEPETDLEDVMDSPSLPPQKRDSFSAEGLDLSFLSDK